MWEAQFGDFANGGQVIIDNFIASGTSKWSNNSSLTLLLPHGFDGNGPEHSSARPERFLQLADDDPDEIPGMSQEVYEMLVESFTKDAVNEPQYDGDRTITPETFRKLMQRFTPVHMGRAGPRGDVVDRLIVEGLGEGWDDRPIVLEAWLHFMTIFLMRTREASMNMNVVNVTTPANLFHVLRRQVHRYYSTPLVVMSPKTLHHHTPCTSPLEHFMSDTHFQRVIGDGTPGDNMQKYAAPTGGSIIAFTEVDTPDPIPLACREDSNVRRVLVCSGKIFYELWRARKASGQDDVAITRVEQLFPFPYQALQRELLRYPDAEVVWVQEEPKNMGAWSYVEPRFKTLWRRLLPNQTKERIGYVGRHAAAAPAGGSYSMHQQEVKKIMSQALQSDPIVPEALSTPRVRMSTDRHKKYLIRTSPADVPTPKSGFPKRMLTVDKKRPVRAVFESHDPARTDPLKKT